MSNYDEIFNELLEWAKEDLDLAKQGWTAPAHASKATTDYLTDLIERAEKAQDDEGVEL